MIETIAASTIGGAIYRWRGHSSQYKKYFPRPINQIVFAIPFALIAGIFCQDNEPTAATTAVTTLGLTTSVVLSGHGQWFLDLLVKKITPGSLDFILVPFFGRDPRIMTESQERSYNANLLRIAKIAAYGPTRLYWRCVAGQTLKGLFYTMPAGVAVNSPELAMSGVLRGFAYLLGDKFFAMCESMGLVVPKMIWNYEKEIFTAYPGIRFLPKHLDTSVEIAEFLAGAFMWGYLAAWVKSQF